MKLNNKQTWFVVAVIVVVGLLYLNKSGGVITPMMSADEATYGGYAESMAPAPEATFVATKMMDSSSVRGGGMMINADSQKVIQSASLSLHVGDVRKTAKEVETLVKGWGGFVENSSVDRYGDSYSAWVTIRIPNDKLSEAILSLKDLSDYVISEYKNAEDVTETYVDLEARLKNFKVQEEQYVAIMDKADTVEDILKVTTALANVRGEIDSLESRLQYYDNRVDYSSITLTLEEDERVSNVVETWAPLSTVRSAFAAWVTFLQALVDDLIYALIYVWPLLILGLAVWILKRKKRS